jgi:hypothetical protein
MVKSNLLFVKSVWQGTLAFAKKSATFVPMKRLLQVVILSAFFFPSFLVGQTKGYKECILDQTDRVNAMLDSAAIKNLEASRIQGFRILIYSGNDRDEAIKAKENAYLLFPKADVYMTYQVPSFKVRFGDFYSRLDAWTTLLKLKAQFPQAVITNEIVNIKP